MLYFKEVEDGYIKSVKALNVEGEEISETDYNLILNAFETKPSATETTDFRLREDLTWEEYESDHGEDDISDEEAFAILTGDKA